MVNMVSFSHKQRRWIVFSYLLFVFIAIPVWWKLTEIYRAKLPLVQMDYWSKGHMCNIQFDIPIVIEVSQEFNDLKGLIKKIRQIIVSKQQENIIKLHIKEKYLNKDESYYTVKLRENNEISSVSRHIYYNRTLYIDYNLKITSELPKIISEVLLDIFSVQEKYMKFHLEKIKDQNSSSKLEDMDIKVVKYSSSFDIVFSLINGGEKNVILFWDIEKAINLYFGPLLKQLSIFSKFYVESQVQFCAELTFSPQKSKRNDVFEIPADRFSEFVNSIEWNLATTLSSHKIINFLVYVPRYDTQPLFFKDFDDHLISNNSFLVPQWGSIVIYNQEPTNVNPYLNMTSLLPIFYIFVSNFLSLLGVPSLPSYIHQEPLPILNTWRLDGLYRQRIVENMVFASTTLGSLSRLVRQISNMAVPDQVQQDVFKTIDHLRKACQNLNDFNSFSALKDASAATSLVEKAFFDPSMVSMLYFPDEHKYGVYLPLFGPLFFPLITALVQEIKAFFYYWRKKSKKKESDSAIQDNYPATQDNLSEIQDNLPAIQDKQPVQISNHSIRYRLSARFLNLFPL
ncbi:hypothetical protein PNEG_03375 [Pneumocystis murina B123]|uniref:GPI transamidase component PIG-S n=1 Tax=Pneumocystis murina (strain B123) TaxID=1069680 RepID=M7P2X5_PNEMU|nr:hypothetical protein PNEG_03375 [Pneumocystis murina B123]EMR08205.1 hypothetical protein PNEG_03375 [Pneumocystis murina B123]